MQGPGWIALLRRIPASRHDCLVVMSTTGIEIVLQRLIRLDRDYLVALGRLSGTTDQPKPLVIPYDQLTYLSFNKILPEDEIEAIFGKPGVAADIADMGSAPEPGSAAPSEAIDFAGERAAETPAGPEEAPAAESGTGQKAPPPSKTILLARLRERLANEVARPGS